MTILRKRLTAACIVVLSSCLLISSVMISKGDDPTVEAGSISGNQTFPPASYSNESSRLEMGAWLNQTLGLDIIGYPVFRSLLYGGYFLDGFNKSITMPAHGWEFKSASGTTLTLQYVTSTREFIALDIRFKPPRPLGVGSLQDFTMTVANSLGFNLINATYFEYTYTHVKGIDPNSTEPILEVHKRGEWRETHDSLPLHIANQLSVWADVNSNTVITVNIYRWFDKLPQLNFTVNDVVNAASEVLNQTHGPRMFTWHHVGLMPNYQNLTWSYLVCLSYSLPHDSAEMVMLSLEIETLDFQGILDIVRWGPSNGGFVIPSFYLFTFLLTGLFILTISIAWYGHKDTTWALAITTLILPLYLRIKKESILDHFLRGRIVEFVSTNPGATFSQIQDKFEVANGVLNYHLWILARTGFLRHVKEGKFSRYYPEGSTNRASVILSSFQYTMLRNIFSAGSISLQRLTQDMESSKQRVHYNVRRLEKLGFIEKDKIGGVHALSLSQKGLAVVNEGTEDSTSRKSTRNDWLHESIE